MKNIYGYIYMSVFVETGFTEKGAKIAATKTGSLHNNGSIVVGYRSYINNMFIKTSVKTNDKWESIK